MDKVLFYTQPSVKNIGDKELSNELEQYLSEFFEVITRRSSVSKSKKRKSFKKQLINSLCRFKATRYILVNIYLLLKKNYINHFFKDVIESGASIVIFGGGNMLFDGDYFPSGVLNYYAKTRILKKHSIPYVFLSIGIGPFKSDLSKKLVYRILNDSEFSTLRDQYSLDFYRELISEEKLFIQGDPALNSRSNIETKVKKNTVALNPISGKLLYSSIKKQSEMYNFYSMIVESLKMSGFEVSLFITDVNDKDVLECLVSEFDVESFVPQDYNALNNYLVDKEFVISTRMHALIFSLRSSKKVLPIIWSGKVRSLVNELKISKYLDIEGYLHSPQEQDVDICKLLSVITDYNREYDILVDSIKKENEIVEKRIKEILL